MFAATLAAAKTLSLKQQGSLEAHRTAPDKTVSVQLDIDTCGDVYATITTEFSTHQQQPVAVVFRKNGTQHSVRLASGHDYIEYSAADCMPEICVYCAENGLEAQTYELDVDAEYDFATHATAFTVLQAITGSAAIPARTDAAKDISLPEWIAAHATAHALRFTNFQNHAHATGSAKGIVDALP